MATRPGPPGTLRAVGQWRVRALHSGRQGHCGGGLRLRAQRRGGRRAGMREERKEGAMRLLPPPSPSPLAPPSPPPFRRPYLLARSPHPWGHLSRGCLAPSCLFSDPVRPVTAARPRAAVRVCPPHPLLVDQHLPGDFALPSSAPPFWDRPQEGTNAASAAQNS